MSFSYRDGEIPIVKSKEPKLIEPLNSEEWFRSISMEMKQIFSKTPKKPVLGPDESCYCDVADEEFSTYFEFHLHKDSKCQQRYCIYRCNDCGEVYCPFCGKKAEEHESIPSGYSLIVRGYLAAQHVNQPQAA